MPRSLILAILLASSAGAAIWPEHLGTYDRRSVEASQVPTDENGREASEHADYGVGSSRVDLQACKLEYSIVSPK